MNQRHCFDLKIEDQIAHLVLKRGEQLNTMTLDFWRELPEIMGELDREAGARVVALSSTGKHFCAGMDLANFAAADFGPGEGTVDAGRRAERGLHLVRQLQGSISSLEEARLPVIAAIQGGCIGGGVDLVTACDLRYCTEDAWFCIQETNIGIVADVGTLQRLPKIVPAGIARELAFTGEKIGAQRAMDIGLVSGVFPDQQRMMAHVRRVAERIAGHSPLVNAGIKRVLNHSRDHSVAEGLEYVALWNSAQLSAEDLKEAMAAHMEKRPAQHDDLQAKRDYWGRKSV